MPKDETLLNSDVWEAHKTLQELTLFTSDVYQRLGISRCWKQRNHNGMWADGQPSGAIMHYTASNSAYSFSRPFGRIPTLLERFQVGSPHKVGVQFIVWGDPIPELMELRNPYPWLQDMPGLIFCPSYQIASWHAGWANSWAYGVEVRNVGRVYRSGDQLYWNKKMRVPYKGEVASLGAKGVLWEPYSQEQLACCVWLGRLMRRAYGTKPELFLGHYHVSSNKVDPGPLFPLKLIRRLSCGDLINQSIPRLKDWGVLLSGKTDYVDDLPSEEELSEGREPRFCTPSADDGVVDTQNAYALADPNQQIMFNDLGYEFGARAAFIFRRRWQSKSRKDWKRMFAAMKVPVNLLGGREQRLLVQMWNGHQRLIGNR